MRRNNQNLHFLKMRPLELFRPESNPNLHLAPNPINPAALAAVNAALHVNPAAHPEKADAKSEHDDHPAKDDGNDKDAESGDDRQSDDQSASNQDSGVTKNSENGSHGKGYDFRQCARDFLAKVERLRLQLPSHISGGGPSVLLLRRLKDVVTLTSQNLGLMNFGDKFTLGFIAPASVQKVWMLNAFIGIFFNQIQSPNPYFDPAQIQDRDLITFLRYDLSPPEQEDKDFEMMLNQVFPVTTLPSKTPTRNMEMDHQDGIFPIQKENTLKVPIHMSFGNRFKISLKIRPLAEVYSIFEIVKEKLKLLNDFSTPQDQEIWELCLALIGKNPKEVTPLRLQPSDIFLPPQFVPYFSKSGFCVRDYVINSGDMAEIQKKMRNFLLKVALGYESHYGLIERIQITIPAPFLSEGFQLLDVGDVSKCYWLCDNIFSEINGALFLELNENPKSKNPWNLEMDILRTSLVARGVNFIWNLARQDQTSFLFASHHSNMESETNQLLQTNHPLFLPTMLNSFSIAHVLSQESKIVEVRKRFFSETLPIYEALCLEVQTLTHWFKLHGNSEFKRNLPFGLNFLAYKSQHIRSGLAALILQNIVHFYNLELRPSLFNEETLWLARQAVLKQCEPLAVELWKELSNFQASSTESSLLQMIQHQLTQSVFEAVSVLSQSYARYISNPSENWDLTTIIKFTMQPSVHLPNFLPLVLGGDSDYVGLINQNVEIIRKIIAIVGRDEVERFQKVLCEDLLKTCVNLVNEEMKTFQLFIRKYLQDHGFNNINPNLSADMLQSTERFTQKEFLELFNKSLDLAISEIMLQAMNLLSYLIDRFISFEWAQTVQSVLINQLAHLEYFDVKMEDWKYNDVINHFDFKKELETIEEWEMLTAKDNKPQ